jgi:cysteine synthase
MMKIGNTPMIDLDGIYAKLECTNPSGSIKDRIAKHIIDESEKKGLLKPGMKIVEATSGNTGIAFSYYAAQKGYPITICMPENMTEERKTIIKSLGAELILTAPNDFLGAAEIRDNKAKDPIYFNPDQFSNPLNTDAHYKTTGQEILKQIKEFTDDPIDAFTVGVGTGGTLMGVSKAIKEVYPNAYIAAVEPSESAVMSGKEPDEHEIFGIGDGFIPEIVKNDKGEIDSIIDEIICITSKDARDEAERIEEKFGYCVGISSGSHYLAAKQLRERFNFKTVVTIFSDGYVKYLGQGLKHCKANGCKYEDKTKDLMKLADTLKKTN